MKGLLSMVARVYQLNPKPEALNPTREPTVPSLAMSLMLS